MSDIETIKRLVSLKEESPIVDFKREFYSKLKNSDFPKDIVAFANSSYGEDKYIIFGIDDDTREILGVDDSLLPSVDVIDDYISRVIEPFVDISMNAFDWGGKTVAYIKIKGSNKNPPYMIKETCGKDNRLEKGDIFIRKGTCNQKANRIDIDDIYINNGEISVKIFEEILMLETINTSQKVFKTITCGHIGVEINNDTTRSYLITNGSIQIATASHQVKRHVFSVLPNLAIDGNPIEIPQKTRKVYTVLFDFLSQDCVDFGFNSEGFMQETAIVQISLFDTDGVEYVTEPREVMMHARGDILHKVRRVKGRTWFE